MPVSKQIYLRSRIWIRSLALSFNLMILIVTSQAFGSRFIGMSEQSVLMIEEINDLHRFSKALPHTSKSLNYKKITKDIMSDNVIASYQNAMSSFMGGSDQDTLDLAMSEFGSALKASLEQERSGHEDSVKFAENMLAHYVYNELELIRWTEEQFKSGDLEPSHVERFLPAIERHKKFLSAVEDKVGPEFAKQLNHLREKASFTDKNCLESHRQAKLDKAKSSKKEFTIAETNRSIQQITAKCQKKFKDIVDSPEFQKLLNSELSVEVSKVSHSASQGGQQKVQQGCALFERSRLVHNLSYNSRVGGLHIDGYGGDSEDSLTEPYCERIHIKWSNGSSGLMLFKPIRATPVSDEEWVTFLRLLQKNGVIFDPSMKIPVDPEQSLHQAKAAGPSAPIKKTSLRHLKTKIIRPVAAKKEQSRGPEFLDAALNSQTQYEDESASETGR